MPQTNDYALFFNKWMARACLLLGLIVLGYLIRETMVDAIEPMIIAMVGIVAAGLFGVSAACGNAARKISRRNL